FEERTIATAGEQLTLVAGTVADDVDALLLERSHAVAVLAREIDKEDDPHSRTIFAPLRAEQDGATDVGLVDFVERDGRGAATEHPAGLGVDSSDRTWFTAARDGAAARIFGPHFGEFAPNELTVGLTAPVLGAAGRFLGVVREEISLSALLYRVRR